MKKIKILFLVISLFIITGCTKVLKDEEKKPVKNEVTGQNITENILCLPTEQKILDLYKEYKIDLSKIDKCENFSINNFNEEKSLLSYVWVNFFVKPLAWLILKLGYILKNHGIAVILTGILIRMIMIPITKKTAMQSENLKKAAPELKQIESKYENKQDQESMMKKSQETMLLYKKYNVNPLSGCLFGFIQLPLFFAFLEAVNRVPAIFEGKLLFFQLGTTPLKALSNGQYYYLIIVVLIALTTYYSFKMTQADVASGGEKQMAMMMNIMIGFIIFASFSLPTAVGLYWVTSSAFTIGQNLIVKRRKKNASI